MRKTSIWWSCVLATVISLCGFQLQAQQNSVITGTIIDQAGKSIPGANVEVRNVSTGVSRSATTDNDGKFWVSDLAPGTYSILASAPGFALTTRTGAQLSTGGTLDVPITMSVESVTTAITVNETISMAAATAPSGNTLEAVSARTEVSQDFIQNFMSPIADYSEYINYAPGTFSINGNGIGLGQGKTFFRGFSDGNYTMTFDGIPFEDTNTPTHHSWAFFPGQFIGQTLFDRSPGTASTIGPTNFGGSIGMMSRMLQSEQNIRGGYSYGSFNTRIYSAAFDSGQFGPGGKHSFLLDVMQLKSDGFQTYNYQKRNALEFKYQYAISPRANLTFYSTIGELKSNTPNLKGPTRAQYQQYGPTYLMSNDPSQANYFGYNFY